MTDAPQYEVRCPQCDVSFPIGTRRCLHCGGATVKPGVAVQMRTAGLRMPLGAALPRSEDEPEEDEALVRRGPRRLTVLWVLIVLAASIYRSCAAPG